MLHFTSDCFGHAKTSFLRNLKSIRRLTRSNEWNVVYRVQYSAYFQSTIPIVRSPERITENSESKNLPCVGGVHAYHYHTTLFFSIYWRQVTHTTSFALRDLVRDTTHLIHSYSYIYIRDDTSDSPFEQVHSRNALNFTKILIWLLAFVVFVTHTFVR